MIAQTDLFADSPAVALRERTLRDLETLPPLTHRKATDTELRAALRAAEAAPSLRVSVLYLVVAMGDRGITADAAIEILKKRDYSIRPRFTELRNMGLVDDSGLRRPNRYDQPEIVWRATPTARVCVTRGDAPNAH